MFKKCDQCGTKLSPKIALDPSQYFAYSISLIDIIDENVEKFISDTDYGAILTLACWLAVSYTHLEAADRAERGRGQAQERRKEKGAGSRREAYQRVIRYLQAAV